MSNTTSEPADILRVKTIGLLAQFLELPNSESAVKNLEDVLISAQLVKENLLLKANGSSLSINLPQGEAETAANVPELSKRERSEQSSFLILYLIQNPANRAVGMDRLLRALDAAGLAMERASLNAKLHRWRNPGLNAKDKPKPKFVDWNKPNRREITGDGVFELTRLSGDLDKDIVEKLIAVADKS